MDFASTRAVLKNKTVEVNFDLDEGVISLADTPTKVYIPSGINIDFEEEKIMFFPDGSSQAFKITITDARQSKSIVKSEGFEVKIE
jgi:hypothetical protein